jgi:hypothetical protein
MNMSTARIIPIPAREVHEDEPETRNRSWYARCGIPDDPTSDQLMRAVEVSGVLDFWDREEENIYTLEDGESV